MKLSREHITKFSDKAFTLILTLVLISFFFQSLTAGLIKGGRWVLYQNIAMADRFLDGHGFYYSTAEASSPYFPGVAFLSILIGKFFNPYRDYILLTMASLIGTIFLYVLITIGKHLSNSHLLSLMITFLLISVGFSSYRSYMNEFKADTLILLLAFFIIIIIERIENGREKASLGILSILFVLCFIMDIVKQQALYIDVAIAVYILFAPPPKKLTKREKF